VSRNYDRTFRTVCSYVDDDGTFVEVLESSRDRSKDPYIRPLMFPDVSLQDVKGKLIG
jgi:hypothetical protein